MSIQKKTQQQTRTQQQSRNSQTTIELQDKIQISVNQNTLIQMNLINSFIIEFAFAIQNVWITSLLIQYQTQSYLDSFIWIIPNILSIIIVPYLESYIHKFKIPVMKYITSITTCLLLATLGHFLVILSTVPQYLINIDNFPLSYHFTRIIISIIGWTIIDVNLQLVGTYNEAVKGFMIENNIRQQSQQQQNVITFGRLAAYGLSFMACATNFSYRNFHIDCSRMYEVSGLICFSGACLMFAMNKIKITKGAQQQKKSQQMSLSYIKQTIKGVKLSITTFFPGLRQTIEAPIKLKIILLQIFSYNYCVDTIYIYGSIWIATTIRNSQDITAQMFTLGVQYGALLLFGFSLLAHITKLIIRPKIQSMFYKISYAFVIIINLSITVYAALQMKLYLMCLIVLFGGILLSFSELFLQHKDEILMRFYPQFQICQGYIIVIQKLFILCPMPFYWMIIRDADDIPGCLIFSSVSLSILLIIVIYDILTRPQIIESSQKKNN